MRQRRGLTLIELVIVIAILGLLIIITSMSWRRQLDKARDAQRKEHLQKISLAYEEYFSDHDCYPPADVLENCGVDEDHLLRPYLHIIPCDPVTNEPYEYIPDANQPACPQNFRILATLANDSDPVISSLGCQSDTGCGWAGIPVYNYGVASKNVTVANPEIAEASPPASAAPGSSPSPTASPFHDYFACSPNNGGQCSYRGTNIPDCEYYWEDSCPVDCANPIYQCSDIPIPSPSPKLYYCEDFGSCAETPPGKTCFPAYSSSSCNNPANPCGGIISICL